MELLTSFWNIFSRVGDFPMQFYIQQVRGVEYWVWEACGLHNCLEYFQPPSCGVQSHLNFSKI